MAKKFSYRPVFDFSSNYGMVDEDTEFFMESLPFTEFDIKTEPSDVAAVATQTQIDAKKKLIVTTDPFLCNVTTNPPNLSQTYTIYDGSCGLDSPLNRKKTGGRKERTPRTLQRLMERHRHNERVRHHTLNERLRVICQFVPGSGEDGRETKVVMMQRIISYIAYLENTIAYLHSQLGLPKDKSLSPLTIQLRRQIEALAKLAVVPDIDEIKSKRPRMDDFEHQAVTPRRYKISSPTIDSTTDIPHYQKYYQNSQESSQDSMAPSSTFYNYNDDNALHWLGDPCLQSTGSNNDDLQSFFDPMFDETHFQTISSTMGHQTNLDIDESLFAPIQESFTLLSASPCKQSTDSTLLQTKHDQEEEEKMYDLVNINENEGFQDYMAVSPKKNETPTQPQDTYTYQYDTGLEHPTLIANHEETTTCNLDDIDDTGNQWSNPTRNKRKQHTPTKREPSLDLTNSLSPEDSQDYTSLYEAAVPMETTTDNSKISAENSQDGPFNNRETTSSASSFNFRCSESSATSTSAQVLSQKLNENRLTLQPSTGNNALLSTVPNTIPNKVHRIKPATFSNATGFLLPVTSANGLPPVTSGNILLVAPQNTFKPISTNRLIFLNGPPVFSTGPLKIKQENPETFSKVSNESKPSSISDNTVPVLFNDAAYETTVTTVDEAKNNKDATSADVSPLRDLTNTGATSHYVDSSVNTTSPKQYEADKAIKTEPQFDEKETTTDANEIETSTNIDKENSPVIHYLPNSWTIHSLNDTTDKKAPGTNNGQTVIKIQRPILKENQPPSSTNTKVDHRKTSWMNGFMMYSRLNRKHFISSNPGVHTAHISKMMGQTWRTMSSQSQQPYKDKAKQFLKEMQKIQDLAEHERKSGSISVLRICPSSTNNISQVSQINVPIPHPSSSSSSTKGLSSSTHRIYNSQKWTYL